MSRPTGPRRGVVVVGDLVTDVLVVHAGPVETGTDTAARIRLGGGGQGANTAAWLAHAGAAVTLIAAIGDDRAGQERVAELAGLGVRCAVRTHSGTATGSVVVLASAGERTMLTDRAAALLLDPAHVTEASAADTAAHLHLTGYPLLDPGSRAGGLAALAAARNRGLTTSVDAGSAGPLRRVGAAAFLEWVRGADLLLCNADEAAELTGRPEAAEQAVALTEVARNVGVKRGDAGALWAASGAVLCSAAAESATVVDSTGAGDAFAAGLLGAWLAGAEPAAALAAGISLGAAAVGRIGARP